MSVSEQEFFDSFADFFKRYAHNEGILEFYYIRAWSSGDGYTYFYLEQPDRTWIRIEDGSSTYVSASNADVLKIPKDTPPVLDDYEAVQEVINMYIDM